MLQVHHTSTLYWGTVLSTPAVSCTVLFTSFTCPASSILRSGCSALFCQYVLPPSLSVHIFVFSFGFSLNLFIFCYFSIRFLPPHVSICSTFKSFLGNDLDKSLITPTWKSIRTSYFMKNRMTNQGLWTERQYPGRTWPILTSFNIFFMPSIWTVDPALTC